MFVYFLLFQSHAYAFTAHELSIGVKGTKTHGRGFTHTKPDAIAFIGGSIGKKQKHGFRSLVSTVVQQNQKSDSGRETSNLGRVTSKLDVGKEQSLLVYGKKRECWRPCPVVIQN